MLGGGEGRGGEGRGGEGRGGEEGFVHRNNNFAISLHFVFYCYTLF